MDGYPAVRRSIKQGTFNYCENMWNIAILLLCSMSEILSSKGQSCKYTVPIRDKRVCPEHNKPLEKSFNCPVEFVYIRPKAKDGNRRWIDGLVCCQKGSTDNLHNHPLHGATKIAGYAKSKITDVHINQSLTASDIAQGKGLPFIPSAVDGASSHIGKPAQIVKCGKEGSGIIQKHRSPTEFEELADSFDKDDNNNRMIKKLKI